jgi:ribosomal protein S18 acetylase RimI-like enzyme
MYGDGGDIDIVHISNIDANQVMDQIIEIVYEAAGNKYLAAFDGDEARTKEVFARLIQAGLFGLDDTYLALDKDSGSILAVLIMDSPRKPPLLTSLKFSLKLISELGFSKISKLSAATAIINKENKRFPSDENESRITLIATKKEFRGKGIGKAMLEHLFAILKAKREYSQSACICKVNLICTANGQPRRLYERLGFKTILEVEAKAMGEVCGSEYNSLVHMSKELV